MATAKNPILSGFYPDPSICRVGEDYYIVNSTFSYFPGLPVMHSKDLAHWEQIGNVMTTNSGLPLVEGGHSAGLFAPTIRYYDGVYYCICTNVSFGGNYVVTATNPAGPWSEPHYLKGADGIDPSLFFDDDGKCYYCGTHPNKDGCRYNGDYFIWVQELNVETFELVGEKVDVWNGAMRDICWPEGPHIYKKDGYYYIMNAEGGTGPNHAVTCCRSRHVFGPYENNFNNPILTHRHLGKDYPIQYVGHADLVETQNGDWYMVMLAVRPQNKMTTMGRETFLAKVVWEDGWPIVNPGVGLLTDTVEVNLPEWKPKTLCTGVYDFTTMNEIGPEFMTLRNTVDWSLVLESGKGLILPYRPVTLQEQKNPSFLCLRQKCHNPEVEIVFDTSSVSESGEAGLCLMQSNAYYVRAAITKKAGKLFARVYTCMAGKEEALPEVEVSVSDEVVLHFSVADLKLQANVVSAGTGIALCKDQDVSLLSTEVAGGFVGCTYGVYAIATQDTKDAVIVKKFTEKL